MWYRALESIADTFVSVELTGLWRLHLVYAKKDGKELVHIFTQRFASITTMLTLLVASQVGTLFSPSRPTERARTALEEKDYTDVAFWAGFLLCLGIIISITALLCTLTAWSLFVVIGPRNAHIILRSSLLIYATALPVRMSLASIYLFFVWVNVFWYVIASWEVALPLSVLCAILLFHVTSTYSAVGRTIMYSGAIGEERIMDPDVEEELSPTELTTALIDKVVVAKEGNVPVSEQYRIKYQEQLEILEEGGSLHFDSLRLPEYQDSVSSIKSERSSPKSE